MKKLHSLVLACVGVISMSASFSSAYAYAGNIAGSGTVTLGGGFESFSSKRHLDSTGFPMIILGYNFTDHWGIEGLLTGFNTKYHKSVNDNRHINGNLFAIDGVYHFSPYRAVLQPYVLAGIGVTGLNPNISNANNAANINAGLGAEYFIHPLVAFRADIRDIYTMVGGKNDFVIDGGITLMLGGC